MRPTARLQLIAAARDVVGYWDRIEDIASDSASLDVIRELKQGMDDRVEKLRDALERLR